MKTADFWLADMVMHFGHPIKQKKMEIQSAEAMHTTDLYAVYITSIKWQISEQSRFISIVLSISCLYAFSNESQ